MRMVMSVALPAPNGTITLIGFDGIFVLRLARGRRTQGSTTDSKAECSTVFMCSSSVRSARASPDPDLRRVNGPAAHRLARSLRHSAMTLQSEHAQSVRSIFTSAVILRHVSSSPLSQVCASSSDSFGLTLTSCLANASCSCRHLRRLLRSP